METTNLPLGRDMAGNPVDVPAEAVAWRVRRAANGRGRPRNVYNCDGQQLEVALDATVEDLREAGCAPGRYRLEAIDASGRVIPGVVGMTEVKLEEEEDDDAPTEPKDARVTMVERDRYIRGMETMMATNARALEALARAFGPVRSLNAPELSLFDGGDDEEDDDGEQKPDTMKLVHTLVGPITQMVIQWLASKGAIDAKTAAEATAAAQGAA
jgi:hypothetical protein